MVAGSRIARLVKDLSDDDWRQALQQGGGDLRKNVGRLLKVATPSRSSDPGLLKVKARTLDDQRAAGLARLLSNAATRVAIELLGEASSRPTDEDLRRIWPEWTRRCSRALAVLSLIVVIDQQVPASESAMRFLNGLGDDLSEHDRHDALLTLDEDEDAGGVDARATGERLEELNAQLVNGQTELAAATGAVLEAASGDAAVPSEALRALNAAARIVQDAIEEASGIVDRLGLHVPLMAPLSQSLRRASDAAIRLAEKRQLQIEVSRGRAELLARRNAAAAAVAPLLRVKGPDEYTERLDVLRSAATPPEDTDAVGGWLSGVPVLVALLDHLRGGTTLDSSSYLELSRLTSPVVLGLALSQELRVSDAARAPEKTADDTAAVGGEGAAESCSIQTGPAEPPASEPRPAELEGNDEAGKPGLAPAGVGEASPTELPLTDPPCVKPVPDMFALDEPLPTDHGVSSEVDPVTDWEEFGSRLATGATQNEGAQGAPQTPLSIRAPAQEPPRVGAATAHSAPQLQVREDAPLTAVVEAALVRPVEVWAGLSRLLGDGQFGAAAWAARAFEPSLGSALEVLAISAALRTDAGPLSEALWARSQSLSDRPDSVASQVLAASLCLAATVSPFTGATELLERLIPCLPEGGPLCDLANTVVSATRQGFVLGPNPAVAGVVGEAGERVEEARKAARQQLAAAMARKIKYQRATRVYRAWMSEDGLLGELLVAARDDCREKADAVRRVAVALQEERELERAIDGTDTRLRGPTATASIIADPRHRLVDLAREALEVVDGWCRAVAVLERRDEGGRTRSLAADVRKAAVAVQEYLGEPLSEGEPSEASVLRRSTELPVDLLVRHLDGGLPAEPEPLPQDVLDIWLPFVHEARLSCESWSAVPAATLRGLLAAPYRSAEDAYEAFASRMDHAGSRRLLKAVEAKDPAAAAELTERREHDLRAARAALLRRIDRIQGEFDELEAYPAALDEREAVVVRGILLDAADPVEDDLLGAATKLDEADAVLERARRLQVRDLGRTLADSDLADDDLAAVQRLLDAGALGAAHERLDAGRQNGERHDVDREQYIDLQRNLLPAYIEAAAVPDSLERAALALRAGQPLEPFGRGPAEPTQRQSHADALDAWASLFRDKRAGDFEGRLRAVLALLALQGPTPRRDAGERMRGSHLAVDLIEARPVLPVVSYELGSGAAGRYRVLVVWEQMSADRLASLAVSDGKQGPHLVLYRGVLTRAQRQMLSTAARADAAASRRILVVDDAVVLAMAFHPAPGFALLEHLVLPFARVSVFTPDVAGNVPPELFCGRRRELEEVMNPNGSNFVYGGRQVGKSALLRAAAREVEDAREPDRRAVYLDVKGLGLGLWRDVDELWLELLDELRRVGVITERSSRAARGDAAAVHIRNWLASDPARRLLVLLDECDDLLDADGRKDFAIIERLRGLMNVSDRRFKVVLAGLHQVQRFERQGNVPLAHLTQQPVNVGPLQPGDAIALLQTPLLALGYALDEAATWRVLSHTNYQAGMIQAFGQALGRALLAAPRPNQSLPTMVDRAFVDRVYAEADLGEQMRKRFMLTINLDDRYRCIAFVIAMRNLRQGMEADYEEAELHATCSYWWPAGFDSMRPALFRGLVEEMVGLGVLVRVDERLRIRNPNVVRLLGTQSQFEAELLDFEAIEPTQGFEASLYRRALPDGGRSPLTEEELAALVAVDAPRLALVGGSVALGIDQVIPALSAKLADRPEVGYESSVGPADVADRLAAASGRTLLVSDCRSLALDEAREVAYAVQEVIDGMPSTTAMRVAILVLGPQALELWSDSTVPPQGLEKVLRLGLRRLTAASLGAWSGEESLGLDRSSGQALLGGTGGWPLLLDRALRGKGTQGWELAAANTREHAMRGTGFIKAALGGLREVETLASILADIAEPVTWPLLAELAEDEISVGARDALAALQLTVEAEDGYFELEPLLLAAVRTTAAS